MIHLPRVQSQAQQQGKFKATAPTLLTEDSGISARFIEVGEKSFPPLRYTARILSTDSENSSFGSQSLMNTEECGGAFCLNILYVAMLVS